MSNAAWMPGWMRKLLRLTKRVLRIAAPCAIAAGVLIRLTVRDTETAVAALYYALPIPMMICWALLGARLYRMQRHKARAMLLAAVCLSVWWSRTGWARPEAIRAEISGSYLRTFFWNIDHPVKCPAAFDEQLDRLKPDIAVLAEAEMLTAEEIVRLRGRHPDMSVQALPRGMVVMVRGRATLEKYEVIDERSSMHALSVQVNGQTEPWRLVLADFSPWPLLPRTERVEKVMNLAKAGGGGGGGARTIIVGDFNTPLDSAGFDSWRASWKHGIADCPGFRGCPESWPMGIPLLAIDHIWLSSDLVPVKAEKGWSLPVDHAWIFSVCGVKAAGG